MAPTYAWSNGGLSSMRRRRLVSEAVRVMSQLRVSYRRSPISAEEPSGRCHGRGSCAGDRLLDKMVTRAGQTVRLHELIASPGVHVLLDRDAEPLEDMSPGPLVHLHRITSNPGRGLTAVRPDGYIGLHCQVAAHEPLAAWLKLINAPLDDPHVVVGGSRLHAR